MGIWSGPTLTRQAESVRRATSAFTRVFDAQMHLVANTSRRPRSSNAWRNTGKTPD
jgi:hypothetical protein